MNRGCISRLALGRFGVVFSFLMAALSVSGATKAADIGFRSVVDLGETEIYSLNTEEESAWVELGDVFAGYEVVAFRPDEKILILRKDGEEYSVSLGTGGISRGDIESEEADDHKRNLRRVAQFALIFANDHNDELPGGDEVESIHDVARLLATVGVNDASTWIAGGDARSGREDSLSTVLTQDRQGLDPHFAAQDVVAIDFATNLTMDMRSTTPIAWTRGLREDGTWDERGAFGSSGGFIVFLGGNVARFSDLNSEGELLRRPDGTPTANILEALPPEAEVVGSGPASLHGSRGSGGEQNP